MLTNVVVARKKGNSLEDEAFYAHSTLGTPLSRCFYTENLGSAVFVGRQWSFRVSPKIATISRHSLNLKIREKGRSNRGNVFVHLNKL